MHYDLVIHGATLVLPDRVILGSVAINGGRIAEILTVDGTELAGRDYDASRLIDAADMHLFPGAVDTHVHFNEPGRTDWEGFATGSAALAAGGATTFCDMPLNSTPPLLDGAAFDAKRSLGERHSSLDFGLWGGLTPLNIDRLPELAARGVMGFKAFMSNSGIDEFLAADDATLFQGMQRAAELGLPVAVHAESDAITGILARQAQAAGLTSWRDYVASRPIIAEVEAVFRALSLAKAAGCSLHVVHVSSAAAVQQITAARLSGVNVTCETCPHYLVLNEQALGELGASAKCAPPLRSEEERLALVSQLTSGNIDFVASDHSPAPPDMKTSHDFFKVWGGIAGGQATLGLMLAENSTPLEQKLMDVARWTSAAAARRYRLPNKGRIEVGYDADLTLVNLDDTAPMTRESLRDRHQLSPYIGRRLPKIVRTLSRGRTVFGDGATTARGHLLKPQPA